MVRSETHFVTFFLNFDQNNAKEGWPKLDKLMVRVDFNGQINQKIYEILS